MTTLRDMITDAVKDHTLIAYYENINEPDYTGTDVDQIMAALDACDEMNLALRSSSGFDGTVGWAMIITGLDDEEQIADYSGEWIKNWHDARGME